MSTSRDLEIGSARDRLDSRLAALQPGERLPAEPQLALELEVSRATLREALRSAEDEGLVVRRPGIGTQKTHRPQLANDLSINTGVSELISSHGLIPGTSDLRVELGHAGAGDARRLGLRRPARVWSIQRVRTADGIPVIASRDVLPERLLDPGKVSVESLQAALRERSLYDYLSDKGLEIRNGVASIYPVKASAALARQLEVKKGTLLLRLVQIDYDAKGDPLLLSDEHHLPDAFEFSVSRRGAGATQAT